jgi:L-ribulose-5-phosphate 3-epimerase
MKTTRRSMMFGLGAAAVWSSASRLRDGSPYPLLYADSSRPAPDSPMAAFHLSVLTDEISQDLDRALAVATREFGMKHVDLREAHGKNIMKWSAAEIADARKLLARYEARVACIASPIFKVDWPGAPKSAYSPVKRDEFGADFTFAQQDDLLEHAFDLARTFETDRIRIFDFWRLEDQKPHRAAIDDTIRRAAAKAAKQKLTLVLENEYACNTATGAEAARLLAAIPDAALQITWDPGNAAFRGETPFPDGYSKIPKNRIGHVHCKDAVRNADGKWEWMAMGRGVIDWAGQFRAFQADGYRHALTLETHWRGGGTPEESSRQSFAGMKGLLEKSRT